MLLLLLLLLLLLQRPVLYVDNKNSCYCLDSYSRYNKCPKRYASTLLCCCVGCVYVYVAPRGRWGPGLEEFPPPPPRIISQPRTPYYCSKAISYAVGFRQSNTALSDWTFFDQILLVFLIVSRVDFTVFVLLLSRGGWCEEVLLYSWRNRSVALSVLRAVSASNGSTNFRPSELVALGLAESRQSYVRGVARSRKPPKLQQAQPLLAAWDRDRALLPSCDTRCWRAELGMRHPDLLREATAGIPKPASAPCMILQCCTTWYGCCVFGGGIGDAIG